jgi:hypothetical protein
MPTVRHLKLLYGAASVIWLGFVVVKLFFLLPAVQGLCLGWQIAAKA